MNMRSTLGFLAGLASAAAYATAYGLGIRPGASWLDQQYLFWVAAPYNATMLRLTGESRFAPDQPAEILKAFAFDVAVVAAIGALVGALLDGLWRVVRPRRRA